ncbi:MAG: hypothetical protein R3E84_05785 [Pseudomonadales bacterium]
MSKSRYQNPDLAWDLNQFNQRTRAMDFVMRFQSTLCVYSPTVELLYSTYEILFPEEQDSKLVILPDKDAYYDTFTRVSSTCVKPTGLYIIPGELISRSGLYLANVSAGRDLGSRQIPFASGLRAIQTGRPPRDPFLPVLTKGDLREFNQSWPVLHLHRVYLPGLTHLSELDRTNMGKAIQEKLESLLVEDRKARVA